MWRNVFQNHLAHPWHVHFSLCKTDENPVSNHPAPLWPMSEMCNNNVFDTPLPAMAREVEFCKTICDNSVKPTMARELEV